MLLAGRRKRLVRALEDPLGADVDPAPGRHLAEHRQALGLEPPELVPGRPARHEQRVRDQHARRSRMRPQHADGLPALHEQRLVVAEREQRADDRAQCVVVARSLPRAAVDDEVLRPLGDLGVEVVQQHPQRSLRRPRPARSARCRAARGCCPGRRRATRRVRSSVSIAVTRTRCSSSNRIRCLNFHHA